DQTFAQVLPVVMLGSLTAIILSGLLNHFGERHAEFSGGGNLVKAKGDDEILKAAAAGHQAIDFDQMAVGGGLAVGVSLLGLLLAPLTGIPAPVTMLFASVLVKATGWLPKDLEEGAYMIHRFFVVGGTYPLLLGVGVAMTPWDTLVAVLTPAYLVAIVATV